MRHYDFFLHISYVANQYVYHRSVFSFDVDTQFLEDLFVFFIDPTPQKTICSVLTPALASLCDVLMGHIFSVYTL